MNIAKIIVVTVAVIAGIALAEDSELVSVKGKGVGVNEDAALKDAYRDAIETAVGLYVDAEQMVKNDELIKDEILTQSNAYIEGYTSLGKSETDGLVTVRILAKVRKQELTRKISGLMPSTTVQIGDQLQQIHAQTTTQQKRGEEGAALLAKALSGIDIMRQLFDVKLVSPVGVPADEMEKSRARGMMMKGWQENQNGGSTVAMDYLFSLQVNKERYMRDFLPNLERVLSQISVTVPEEVKLGINQRSTLKRFREKYEDPVGHKGSIGNMHLDRGQQRDSFSVQIPQWGETWGHTCLSIRQGFESLPVVLVTKANDSLMVVRGKKFTLDAPSASVYLDWHNHNGAKADGRHRRRSESNEWNPTYTVSFLDAEGEPLVEQNIQFSGLNVDSATCEGLYSTGACNALWLISPWQDCSATEYCQWFRFKLPKSDLPKIKSIKVELAN